MCVNSPNEAMARGVTWYETNLVKRFDNRYSARGLWVIHEQFDVPLVRRKNWHGYEGAQIPSNRKDSPARG